ncbi:enoyl-CoA hydratase/isomerase family protein [Streptomyces sp. NPDC004752]
MSEPGVRVVKSGATTWIRFDDPRTRNAISQQVAEVFQSTLQAATADPRCRCIVIAGENETFCSGLNLKEAAVADADSYASLIDALQAATSLIFNSDKPVIAAMDGYAVGGGLELVLACDLRVASDRMKAWMPEVGLGVSMTNGSSLLLPHLVGAGRARRMVLLGDRVGAAEALRIGLVDEVVSATNLDSRVAEIADRLCAQPPEALGAARRLLREVVKDQLDAALKAELEYTRTLIPPPL